MSTFDDYVPKVGLQRKRQTYYLRYRMPGETKEHYVPAGTNKREAQRRQAELQASLYDASYTPPSAEAFESVATEWLSNERYVLAESTWQTYHSIVHKHLLPHFGRRPIVSISTREIANYRTTLLASGLGSKTVNNIVVVLSRVFEYARDGDLITKNPTARVKRLAVPASKVDYLQPDEIGKLLNAVAELSPWYHPLFVTACMTGMRMGELRALRWEDVDLAEQVIYVRRSHSRATVKVPKTAAGIRMIPMTPDVCAVLQERHIELASRTELVFPSKKLTPFDPANLRKRVLQPALEHAGLPAVRFHSLRHTFASLLAAASVGKKESAGLLGHASTHVTDVIYTHLFDGADRAAIDRLANYMSQYVETDNGPQAEEERAPYTAAGQDAA